MRRALAVVLAVAVAAAVVSCGRKREYPPPERYLPADAPVSVVIPGLGTAARQAGALYRTVAPAPPAVALVEAYGAVKAQLGFDPLDARGLEQAGIDPGGAAGASLGAGRTPLLVLPVLDLSRFDATASRLARDRMGATERITSKSRGVDLVTYRRPGSGSASLAYVAVGPHAILAPGPQGPETVVSAATAPEEASLLRSATWARARAALGDGFLATVLAPPGSPALSDLRFLRDGAALGVRASATQLGLRVAALLTPEREAWWKGLQPPAAPPAAAVPELAGALPKEAALVLRWAGDPAAAARQLQPWMPEGLRAALASAQVDLAGTVAPALGPGGVASLSLSPSFTVAEFSSPALDPRRTDPFDLLQLDAVIPVRDPAPLRALMARLQKGGPRLPFKVAPRSADASAWTVSWGKARLGVALSGDRLAVAGNADRLPALEARLGSGGGFTGSTPPAKGAVASGLAGAVLDVEHLAASVESLPQSAYGTGPNAVVMRSLVNRYLEPAHALATVSLRLGVAPGAALLDLDVEGRSTPPPPARP